MNDYFVYKSDMSPHEIKRQWIEKLCPGQVSELFNYMPDTLYFVKDLALRLMAGNQTFVERCGFQTEEEMIGKSDREIFPIEMAEKYMNDDRKVIASKEPLIEIVELFPNQIGEPEWFVTNKIPLFDQDGKVAGVCGLVKSFEGVRTSLQPYLDLLPVTEYLKNNSASKVSMPDLAKSIGMSVRKLQRRFQETFKTSPQKYVGRLRILEACELLVKTKLPVTEIALQVGFYDHSAFSKKFSELIGMSPRDYRKRLHPLSPTPELPQPIPPKGIS
ncbi:AraC family transcriptional regulator [Akkermansiaceae bacterium]|nr:AraC family transcriptional regulator [Akkermansiaceae bacterium]MDB4449217.1 AraC family transcriptional regulator [bacterium]MDA7540031.1 AraC family transcriptional regulator [Akkermansiaceae bacterium]MDA7639041.1 AraC family transcriptional regulator [Akkermansiaceae bacterium]MDA7673804.1 AraC family transcriptional regulator [Akkermansiaceae bacterium]